MSHTDSNSNDGASPSGFQRFTQKVTQFFSTPTGKTVMGVGAVVAVAAAVTLLSSKYSGKCKSKCSSSVVTLPPTFTVPTPTPGTTSTPTATTTTRRFNLGDVNPRGM